MSFEQKSVLFICLCLSIILEQGVYMGSQPFVTHYTPPIFMYTHSLTLTHSQGGSGALLDSAEHAETGQGSRKQPQTDVGEHLVDP